MILILPIIFGSAAITSNAQVQMTIDPDFQIAEIGQNFSINISIDPVSNPITGAQFSLLFNRSYIEIQNITEGNLFKQNGSETLFSSGLINNTEGTLINVWGLVITPGINVTTKGTFATISIYAKKKGTTKLNLTNVIISDPFSNSIQTNIINGSLEISDTTKHVASIRNLKNASYAQYYINWSWTDPADTDLSKVMVYIDGKFRSNVSRGIQYYNSTGLIPGSMYTISTRTVDIAGNINKTWVNHSALTMP